MPKARSERLPPIDGVVEVSRAPQQKGTTIIKFWHRDAPSGLRPSFRFDEDPNAGDVQAQVRAHERFAQVRGHFMQDSGDQPISAAAATSTAKEPTAAEMAEMFGNADVLELQVNTEMQPRSRKAPCTLQTP